MYLHHRRKAPLPVQNTTNPTPRTPKTVTIVVPLCEHTTGRDYGHINTDYVYIKIDYLREMDSIEF